MKIYTYYNCGYRILFVLKKGCFQMTKQEYDQKMRRLNAIKNNIKKVEDGTDDYKIYLLENIANQMKFIGHTQNGDIKDFVDTKVRRALRKKGKPSCKFEEDVVRMKNTYGEAVTATRYVVTVIDTLPADTFIDVVKHLEDIYKIEYDTFFNGLNENIGNITASNMDVVFETMARLFQNGVSINDLSTLMYLTPECVTILLKKVGINPNPVVSKTDYTYASIFGNEPPNVEQEPKKLIDPPFTIRF